MDLAQARSSAGKTIRSLENLTGWTSLGLQHLVTNTHATRLGQLFVIVISGNKHPMNLSTSCIPRRDALAWPLEELNHSRIWTKRRSSPNHLSRTAAPMVSLTFTVWRGSGRKVSEWRFVEDLGLWLRLFGVRKRSI